MPILDFVTGDNWRAGVAGTNWDSSSTGAYTPESQRVRRTGGASHKLVYSTSRQWRQKNGTGGSNFVTMVGYVSFDSLPTVACLLLSATDGLGAFVGIGFDPTSGQFQLRSSANSNTTIDTNLIGVTPSTGSSNWYRLEFTLDMSASTWHLDGGVALGDGPITTGSTVNIARGAAATVSNYYIGSPESSSNQTFTAYFTDIAVSLTAADYPIGPISVVGFAPASVGTHNLDASTSQYFFTDPTAPPGSGGLALTTSETTSYRYLDEIPIDGGSDAVSVAALISTNTITRPGSPTSAASTTVTIPSGHASGDLILMGVWRSGSSSAPTVPSGWTNLVTASQGGSTKGWVGLYYKIAASSSETSGTWTSATALSCAVYRNAQTPVANDANATIGVSTVMNYPSVTNTIASPEWAAAFGFTASSGANTTPTGLSVPSGYTEVATRGIYDSNGGIAWSGQNVTISSQLFGTLVVGVKPTTTTTEPTNTWYLEYGFAQASCLDYLGTGTSSGATENVGSASSNQRVAEKVTLKAGFLATVDYYALIVGSPSDNFQIQICADSSGAPGTSISTVTVAAATFTGTSTLYTAALNAPISTDGDYWIVFSRTGSTNVSNYYVVQADTLAHTGLTGRIQYNGSSWGSAGTNAIELRLQTTLTTPTVADPPLGTYAAVGQNLDTATSSTWVAKLYDSVNGTNVEDIANGTISTSGIPPVFARRAFPGRPFTISSVTAGTNLGQTTGGFQAYGQQLTSLSGPLIVAEIQLAKVGSPSDGVYLELRDDSSGVPGGTVLATSATISSASISTVSAVKTFRFSAPYATLASGSTYWLVIRRTGATDDSNYYSVAFDTTNPYSGGVSAGLAAGSSSWQQTGFATWDLAFSRIALGWTLASFTGARLRFGYTAAADGNPRLEAAGLEAAFNVPYVKTGIGISPFTGGGGETHGAAGGGTTYTKTGLGKSDNFTGGGADAFTDVDTGVGISPFTGGGGDAFTDVDTGLGKSDNFVGKGADAFTDVDTGTGISPFTGGGGSAPVYSKTGIAPSAFTGHGADAFTDVDTGVGIAPFTGNAPDQLSLNKTGVGIAPFTGGGTETKSGSGVTYVKTGIGVMGQISSAYVKTGLAFSDFDGIGDGRWVISDTGVGISPFTGGGADAWTKNERGTGISDNFTGSGADAFTDADTGVGISPFTGGGFKNRVDVDTGVGISPFTGGGGKATTFSKAGGNFGASAFTGHGADAFTDVDTGTGISPFTGGGASFPTDADSGIGIAPFTGGGASQFILNKTGVGIAPFTGNAPDAFTDVDTGTGISPFTGGGAKARTDVDTGLAFSAFTGHGADAFTDSDSGTGISPFTGNAPDAFTDVDTGTGISPFTGGGTSAPIYSKTGVGISPFTGGGADAFTDVDSGTGVSPFTGGGAKARTDVDTGTGIAPFTGGGSKASTFSKTGVGISPFTGGGADAFADTDSGTGIAPFTGGGADAFTDSDSGTGIAPFTGGGTDQFTLNRTGAGVAPFTGGGSDSFTLNRTGAGVAPFTGSGADAFTDVDSGTGIAPFTGGGASAPTDVDSGTGISPFTGGGSRAMVFTKTGVGISPFTGGGTETKSGGATYTKTGIGIAPFTGGGADAFTDVDTGTGVAPFTGGGSSAPTDVDSGTGIAPFTGGGADAFTDVDSGVGIAPFTGGGADAFTDSDSGTGISPFTGGGSDAFTLTRSGTGIAPFTGSGADASTLTRSGTGISPFTGSGADAFTDSDTGTGISPFTGGGTKVVVYAETGAGISPFTGGGSAAPAYAKTGTGIAPFTGSGADAFTDSDSGTGVSPFTGGGASAVFYTKTGIGISPFTGSGASAATDADTGDGISDFDGSGAKAVVFSKTGTAVAGA